MEAVVEPAIKTKKLSKVFGNRRAVNNVSIEVPQGAFLSIFGPNGAGKTTLLRVLSTLSRATSGSATLMGVDLKEDPDKARDHIGLISHNSMLYPDLTAEQNLMIYARLYGVVDPEARVLELLEAVELKHRRLDVVRTFSRGMTQRLSIARALIRRAPVLIFDDTTSALDLATEARLYDALRDMAPKSTKIIVAQRIATVRRADKIVVLENGRIAACGSHDELLRTCDTYREIVDSQMGEEESHG